MNPLQHMIEVPHLQQLFTHPVIASFTSLKWQKIQYFLFANIGLWVSFCLLLTIYLSLENNLFEYRNGLKINTEFEPTNDNAVFTIVQGILLLLIAVLCIRELTQIFLLRKDYLKNWENYLEVLIIVLSCTVIGIDRSSSMSSTVRPQIGGLVIFLAWFSLVFYIGKYPGLSVKVEILRKVSLTFAYTLICYVPLIIAFALSFYDLFNISIRENNAFTNFGASIVKTLVMLTGEFEYSNIPLDSLAANIIFVIFVFLGAVVFMNLLIGLAVADTKEIQEQAFFISYKSHVRVINYFDSLNDGANKYANIFSGKLSPVFTFLIECIGFFQWSYDPKITVIMDEDRNTSVEFSNEATYSIWLTRFKADPEMIETAIRIKTDFQESLVWDQRYVEMKTALNEIKNAISDLQKQVKIFSETTYDTRKRTAII